MQINVTAEDIETGVACDYSTCPIARALMRTIRRHVSVVADCWYDDGPIDQERGHGNTGMPLPDIARAFIEAFDHKGQSGFEDVQFVPFSFEIDWPTK